MDPISIAAIGMQSDLFRLNTISQNLANVMTPGYKRGIPVAAPFGSLVEANSAASAPESGQSVIDPRAGALAHTGNAMDIAVDGTGFFEVMTEHGPAYTRQGSLHRDLDGRLVTTNGMPIMGVGGEISTNGTQIVINRNGEVRDGDRIAGEIKVVRFANPESLTSLGNGLFTQGSARMEDSHDTASLRIGYQEASNVNSAHEMIKLTETVRHFEAMQKVMQGYDDVLEKSIRKLGEF